MGKIDFNGTLVFDLDGTLVDSNRDLTPAVNRVTVPLGLPPISREDLGHTVGQGALMMIRKTFSFHGVPLDEATLPGLMEKFLETYEAHIADETVFFDGCLDALDALSADGWKLAVCTNKYEHLARKLLAALGELDRFPVVTGGDTFAVKKPDPGHILETVRLANGDPQRAIMIGDSINDIAAAKAANIPVIAVSFGYTDVPVEELGPDRIIAHFNEMPTVVDEFSRQW